MEWTEYIPDRCDDYIPISQWGQDHWSTLAYLEHCAVERKGEIQNTKMRCNARIHREFAANAHAGDGTKYPTKLRNGERERHDDWSCLEDMVEAGLVRAFWREKYPNRMFNNSIARVQLTERGKVVAAELRQHKAAGGTWSSFVPTRGVEL